MERAISWGSHVSFVTWAGHHYGPHAAHAVRPTHAAISWMLACMQFAHVAMQRVRRAR